MNSLGWGIAICIGLIAYAISESVFAGILWGAGFALVMMLMIWLAPDPRKRRRF